MVEVVVVEGGVDRTDRTEAEEGSRTANTRGGGGVEAEEAEEGARVVVWRVRCTCSWEEREREKKV